MGLYSKSGPEISSRQLIASASNGQEGCEHLQSPLGGDGMGKGGGRTSDAFIGLVLAFRIYIKRTEEYFFEPNFA